MNDFRLSLMPKHVCTLVSDDNQKLVDIVDEGNVLQAWLYYRGSVEKNLLTSIPKAELNLAGREFHEIVSRINGSIALFVKRGQSEAEPGHAECEGLDLEGYIKTLREYYQISSHLAEIDPEHFDED